MSDPIRVLVVCTGNICRSPTAHAVLRSLIAEKGLAGRLECDSAGTQAYHEGDPADPRSRAVGERNGLDFSFHRARRVKTSDFEEFDWILAMDQSHLEWLREHSQPGQRAKLALFLEPVSGQGTEMPDPYYGGPRGFENVLDLCRKGSEAWMERWLGSSAKASA
jgi:protein-tyrosine phosphatase